MRSNTKFPLWLKILLIVVLLAGITYGTLYFASRDRQPLRNTANQIESAMFVVRPYIPTSAEILHISGTDGYMLSDTELHKFITLLQAYTVSGLPMSIASDAVQRRLQSDEIRQSFLVGYQNKNHITVSFSSELLFVGSTVYESSPESQQVMSEFWEEICAARDIDPYC